VKTPSPLDRRESPGWKNLWQQVRAERDDLPLTPDPHFAAVTIDTIGRSSGPIQVWRNWHSRHRRHGCVERGDANVTHVLARIG
jgi:hypothetical protein